MQRHGSWQWQHGANGQYRNNGVYAIMASACIIMQRNQSEMA
jgi:hypothetical protein